MRVQLLILPICLLVPVCTGSFNNPLDDDRGPLKNRPFPPGFEFGAATAAFQVEGAWNVSDKSQSIWDVYNHIPGKVDDNTTGDDACKSYEFFKRDREMLRYLGVDFYRFSISWPRILPNGFAYNISQEGIDHYNEVIDDLLKYAIDPVVTIYHWDLPQCLQDLGGWTNPLIVQWMEDYARVLFENFGDRVKTWITINEPKQLNYGYDSSIFAPGINSHGIATYLVARHVVLAHSRIWHMYNNEFRDKQKGMVGITIATDFQEGLTNSPEDIQAGQDAMEFEVGLYAHPIFSPEGGYPERLVKLVAEKSAQQGFPRNRLPEFTQEEIEYCRGSSDFYGFNHYSTHYHTRKGYNPDEHPIPSVEDDLGVTSTFLKYRKCASRHMAVIPHGIRRALKWVKDSYNNPLVMITENGYGSYGDLHDDDRIDFYRRYLSHVLDAIYEDGCNVYAYTAWSLMDNFEWIEGYKTKFGIFKVFYDDRRTRQARLSAIWYRNLLASRTLDTEDIPSFEIATF